MMYDYDISGLEGGLIVEEYIIHWHWLFYIVIWYCG